MSGISIAQDYVIARDADRDAYSMWRFDPGSSDLLTPCPLAPDASFNRHHRLLSIGAYLLQWSPLQSRHDINPYYCYRLFPFDPTSRDPLAAGSVQQGQWLKQKFWGRSADFGNPHGGHEAFERSDALELIPFGTYVLNFIPTKGRGTFELWNFDPCPTSPGAADPLPDPCSPQGAFRSMQLGDELIPLNGYALDRNVDTGKFALWSFDPQAEIPLAYPPVQAGSWSHITADHQLVAVGEHILDWAPATRQCRVWLFDPHSADPLTGPVASGRLPEALGPSTSLLGVQANLPAPPPQADTPATMEFMRSKIKHIVYYMIENRSFDHACGWLYEHGEEGIHVVGRPGPFQGASTEYFNMRGDKKVHLSKYKDGKLSTDYALEMFTWDPYHDNSDVLRQLFSNNPNGYAERAAPDMGGFVENNGSDTVMQTYSPEQLPVLNGLARHFAISDEWFCSIPSGTDVNRAFSLTGSALQVLNNFMSPPEYYYWPDEPHRPSIWKLLWANGFTDWKIYNSTLWYDYVFTYQLFLENQIPTVDANRSNYVADIDQFYQDARSGELPAFSYLEPVWIAKTGTTSYHPGEDLVPAERQLNEIYNAVREGPKWEETLLIVTFDEHGGIFDHVPPPYAENPWPNDVENGFRYDLMGPRIPTILVSPWIDQQTVFRTTTDVPYDATSFLATLFSWYGIPRARWFMGERAKRAPTFESVFTRSQPRLETPAFTPPYDKQYPPAGEPTPTGRVHDLHRMVMSRMIWSMAHGKLPVTEIRKLVREIDEKSVSVSAMTQLLDDVKRRFS